MSKALPKPYTLSNEGDGSVEEYAEVYICVIQLAVTPWQLCTKN